MQVIVILYLVYFCRILFFRVFLDLVFIEYLP